MIDPTPRAEDLEAGLAEIDRRLRQIQDELVDAEPPSHTEAESPARRPGRAGPLAAVLQRASRMAPHSGENPPAAHQTRRAEEARAQLDDLERQLHALADLRDKLLASIRELVDGYQAAALAQPGAGPPPGEGPEPAGAAEVTVSAGPFANLDAVRAFEHSVARLPGVRETSVRGYEGTDRAIVDVRLADMGPEAPPAPRS